MKNTTNAKKTGPTTKTSAQPSTLARKRPKPPKVPRARVGAMRFLVGLWEDSKAMKPGGATLSLSGGTESFSSFLMLLGYTFSDKHEAELYGWPSPVSAPAAPLTHP